MGGPPQAAVDRQHAPCVQDDQCWGPWAHQRTEAQGRSSSLAPEVSLGQTRGRAIAPVRRRRGFRLRQLTRQVREDGQRRRHTCGVYGAQARWPQTVEGVIEDDAGRIEHAEPLIVVSLCLSDATQRRIITVEAHGQQP